MDKEDIDLLSVGPTVFAAIKKLNLVKDQVLRRKMLTVMMDGLLKQTVLPNSYKAKILEDLNKVNPGLFGGK